METTKGWCKWYVTDNFIINAIQQLEENGVDMRKVYIIPIQYHTGDYLIIYKNE